MTLRPIWIARRRNRVHTLLANSTTACGLAVPPSSHKSSVHVPLQPGIREIFCGNCMATVRGGHMIDPWTPADVEDPPTRRSLPCP